MFDKVKKIAIIITIALLFGFFSFSLSEAFIDEPRLTDYCTEEDRPRLQPVQGAECQQNLYDDRVASEVCEEKDGRLRPVFDDNGCVVDYECDLCSVGYEDALDKFKLFQFLLTSIVGMIAIIIGLYIKAKTDVIEWVFSGLVIGGLFSIFIATMSYYERMDELLRPFVLLLEMIIIIIVAVKTSKLKK